MDFNTISYIFSSDSSKAYFIRGTNKSQTLHGFSDASTVAYGAVVYLQSIHEDDTITVTLVTSKLRVAPLKLVTIPRLELVAAHLLPKLLLSVSNDLSIPLSQINAWTDSRIVLCWFQKNPSTLKMFVSHRVSSVQQMIPVDHWRYVLTNDNPADLASRGIDSQALVSSTLWWEGLSWLGLPGQCSSLQTLKRYLNFELPLLQQPKSSNLKQTSLSGLATHPSTS